MTTADASYKLGLLGRKVGNTSHAMSGLFLLLESGV